MTTSIELSCYVVLRLAHVWVEISRCCTSSISVVPVTPRGLSSNEDPGTCPESYRLQQPPNSHVKGMTLCVSRWADCFSICGQTTVALRVPTVTNASPLKKPRRNRVRAVLQLCSFYGWQSKR